MASHSSEGINFEWTQYQKTKSCSNLFTSALLIFPNRWFLFAVSLVSFYFCLTQIFKDQHVPIKQCRPVSLRRADFPGAGCVCADGCGQELFQLSSAVKSNEHLWKGWSYDLDRLWSLRSRKWNEKFGREEICCFIWLLNTNWFWCWHWLESLISLFISAILSFCLFFLFFSHWMNHRLFAGASCLCDSLCWYSVSGS